MSGITPYKPLVANTPSKGKVGAFCKTTPATTKQIDAKTFKQAVMNRSKLPSRKGTKATVYLA